jgi:AraC-like DNA-binding protein
MRLVQAEVWLDAGLSSAEVARQLYFRDAPHFCREFKRARGVSPQAWRAGRAWWRRVSGQELPFTPVRLPPPPLARVFPSERDFPWLGVG